MMTVFSILPTVQLIYITNDLIGINIFPSPTFQDGHVNNNDLAITEKEQVHNLSPTSVMLSLPLTGIIMNYS